MYLTVISLPGSPAARLPPLASAIFCRFFWWCRTFLSLTSLANWGDVGLACAGTAATVVAASERPRSAASAALRMTLSPLLGDEHPNHDIRLFSPQDARPCDTTPLTAHIARLAKNDNRVRGRHGIRRCPLTGMINRRRRKWPSSRSTRGAALSRNGRRMAASGPPEPRIRSAPD